MKFCGEVGCSILLTVIVSVVATATDQHQPQEINRQVRSFSSMPREGNEPSSTMPAKDKNKKVNETKHSVEEKIPVEILIGEVKDDSLGTKSSFTGDKIDTNNDDRNTTDRLPRSDETKFRRQSIVIENTMNKNEQDTNKNDRGNDKNEIRDENSFHLLNNFPLPYWVPDEGNVNTKFTGPLDKNVHYSLPPFYNGNFKNDDYRFKENTNNQISDSNNLGLFSEANKEENKKVMSQQQQYNKFVRDQFLPPQINFNPTLKDIFSYNPVFDYIKKTDDIENDQEDNPNKNNGYVKRKIQHYQTVYRPNPLYFLNRNNNLQELFPHINNFNENNYFGHRPENTLSNRQNYEEQFIKNWLQHLNQNNNFPGTNENNVPPMYNGLKQNLSQKIWDDYFPVVIQNPFNSMWTAFTNIVEYGPEADVCKKKKNKRNKRRGRDLIKGDIVIKEEGEEDDYDSEDFELRETNDKIEREVEDDISDKSFASTEYPSIRRLKVRRGGVAIAGPGGIATAGSGGTAIVGPGGTAYTREDGTAIVGPGGRLVHVPEFFSFPTFKKPHGDGARTFKDPPGSKFIAMGPLIYYNLPSESD